MFLKFLLKIVEPGARRTYIVSTVCIRIKDRTLFPCDILCIKKMLFFSSYAPCLCENKNENNVFSSVIPDFFILIVSDQKTIGSLGIPISDELRR